MLAPSAKKPAAYGITLRLFDDDDRRYDGLVRGGGRIAMKLHCTIEIARPTEAVFPWIAEPERAVQWQRGVKDWQMIHEEPERVGTTFRETVEDSGGRLDLEGVIVSYEANKSIGFHLSSRIHEFDASYHLTATEGGTSYAMEATVRWKFPMSMVSLVLGRTMAKRLEAQLLSEAAELKRVCELE